MAYDYQSALKAGANEDQVLDYLNKTRGYNVEGALQAGASKSQIIDYLAKTEKPSYLEPKPEQNAVAGFATGVAQSFGKLAFGAGKLGEKILRGTVGKGVEALTGKELGEPTYNETPEILKAKNTSQKIGQFAGDVAQFAIPGSGAAKATKGASILTRGVAEGVTAGGVQALQSGEVDEDTAITAIFGGVTPAAGKGLRTAYNNLTQKLPEWIVRPLLKQAKDAKVKGKDIAPYLVKSGRIGSVDSIVSRTGTEIENLSKQISQNLEKAGTSGTLIKRDDIFSNLVSKLNEAGDATDIVEVQTVIERLAPQARGLLKKETLTPAEANKLRQALDRTLGDKAFLKDQLPYNKEVLRGFANDLRESVKTNAPEGTRGLFDKLSKEITLRDALLERASSGGGANRIGLYDILSSGIGFSQGDSTEERLRNAAIGFGARRAFESGTAKTFFAQIAKSPELIAPKLDRLNLSPSVRGLFLEIVDRLASDDDAPETN